MAGRPGTLPPDSSNYPQRQKTSNRQGKLCLTQCLKEVDGPIPLGQMSSGSEAEPGFTCFHSLGKSLVHLGGGLVCKGMATLIVKAVGLSMKHGGLVFSPATETTSEQEWELVASKRDRYRYP